MADTYIVQPGDTLSGIAERFGVSLSDLEAANPKITDPNAIFPGQVINIPGGEQPKGKDDKDKEKDQKDQKDKDQKDQKDKDQKDQKDKDQKDQKDKDQKDQKDKDKDHKDHKD